jgi:hypothetical protein
LEPLRKIVPHAEWANTATFLEEVINYIERLNKEIAELKGEGPPPTAGTVGAPAGNTGPAEGSGVSAPVVVAVHPIPPQGPQGPPMPAVHEGAARLEVQLLGTSQALPVSRMPSPMS